MDDEIIISDNLAYVAKMQHDDYVTHALCSSGSCRFRMDEKAFTLAEGDCMIVPQQEVAFSVESASADFRQRREVGYYADALCVSAKYLSEVCKRVSGQSAIYWITRYTSLDIARQLRTTDLTAEQLADLYGFADANYFVRYVRKNLGTTPSSFRG